MTKVYTQSLVTVINELTQKLSERQNDIIDISEWLSLAGYDL